MTRSKQARPRGFNSARQVKSTEFSNLYIRASLDGGARVSQGREVGSQLGDALFPPLALDDVAAVLAFFR